jgi:hypothetical protein
MKYDEWFTDLIKSDSFISSDKYLDNQKKGSYIYKKRDYLFKFGRGWRGKIQCPVVIDRLLKKSAVLVTGHSDIPLTLSDLGTLQRIGFKKVYGTNTLNLEGFSESIPLGLTNDCDDSPFHRILGNTSHFKKAHESTSLIQDYTGSIYVNFTSSNNEKVRATVIKLVKDRPNTKFEDLVISDTNRIDFLASCRGHSFVLAPEGNGYDTHRLWETLYMGGTPIIKYSPYIPTILTELPVVIVNSWTQIVDEEFLEVSWQNAQNKRENLRYLEIEYWLDRMSKSVF